MQEDTKPNGVAVQTQDAQPSEKPQTHQQAADEKIQTQSGRSDGGKGHQWRERAERAESKVNDLTDRLAQSESSLEQARHTIDAVELRRTIEHDLVEADAIDLETATILTQAALETMDEPDAAVAIQDLRRRKPFLFRSQSNRPSAMSALSRPGQGALDDVAESARRSGDRRELLRYLRMKRGA